MINSTKTAEWQESIDSANASFWNELCGSAWAQQLGITTVTPESLKRFDEEYFKYYPYLLKYINPARLKNACVLEVGLGYGSVGQKIVEAGAEYVGFDIAKGPVAMMNDRLKMHNLSGTALQGNILDSGLESESFDFVIAIGCYHHTGNAQRAIDETFRLLKSGGMAVIMIYNQFSYRQWLSWPLKTTSRLLHDLNILDSPQTITNEQRKSYDYDPNGNAAPETAFFSVKEAKKMFKAYSSVKIRKENCNDVPYVSRFVSLRPFLLPIIGHIAGLDLYIEARK